MYNPTHRDLEFGLADTERFWSKVEISGSCWRWLGRPNNTGYGVFSFAHTSTSAHRASYIINVGQIPDGLHLDHLCGNRMCVNPAHLEPVTRTENQRRITERKTACSYGHALTPENVLAYETPRSGWRRYCRECRRNTWRKAAAKRRARTS